MCKEIGKFCPAFYNLVQGIDWCNMKKDEQPITLEDIIMVHIKCVKN